VFAWPDALIGIMSSRQAVSIISRRDIAEAADPETHTLTLADDYAQLTRPPRWRPSRVFVDEVITPDAHS